ncbi:MAG: AAA family ATPase [Alphaproteobacteria bacterium]|nr:AAA family ATPase [Alphaproteobacteria bacterium]
MDLDFGSSEGLFVARPVMTKPSNIHIRSVSFDGFKALAKYTISLREMNILVGSNNSGKSTVIAAFRALAAGIKVARARTADIHTDRDGSQRSGWNVPPPSLPISLENVHTMSLDNIYETNPARVVFRLSTNDSLILHFPVDGGCIMFAESEAGTISKPSHFKKYFPLEVGTIPVLGPVEHDEESVESETVTRNLSTHRASRNFRNYWRHFPSGFDQFSSLLSKTWPGMDIKRPQIESGPRKPILRMYCNEDRVSRELYWLGFGFQIWCQLLTHVIRHKSCAVLVVDEPETYLHPDIQRSLINILRETESSVIMATHSSEIIGEADVDELLLVDKTKPRAKRITTSQQLQDLLHAIGSLQNPTLTKLARTKRLLFVEGHDFKIIAQFARKIGMEGVADQVGLTVVPIGGFSNYERVNGLGWGFSNALKEEVTIGIILDRDYRTDGEIQSVKDQLSSVVKFSHIHSQKEIENYLLVPQAMHRAAQHGLSTKSRAAHLIDMDSIIERTSRDFENICYGHYSSKRVDRLRQAGKDPATAQSEVRREFESLWQDPSRRLMYVSGKSFLTALNRILQQEYSLNLTPSSIIRAMHRDEVPKEIVDLIVTLDAFRAHPVGIL